jgi:hypothetical protein
VVGQARWAISASLWQTPIRITDLVFICDFIYGMLLLLLLLLL